MSVARMWASTTLAISPASSHEIMPSAACLAIAARAAAAPPGSPKLGRSRRIGRPFRAGQTRDSSSRAASMSPFFAAFSTARSTASAPRSAARSSNCVARLRAPIGLLPKDLCPAVNWPATSRPEISGAIVGQRLRISAGDVQRGDYLRRDQTGPRRCTVSGLRL